MRGIARKRNIFVVDITVILYSVYMLGKTPTDIYKNYFGVMKFTKKYPDEMACEKELFAIKYPNGFKCEVCGHSDYYQMTKAETYRRSRILECKSCKKQTSITSNTMFQGTKVSLYKWFWAIFFLTQGKKGISGWQLSKHIEVSEPTARLMLYKIRKQMQEDAISYQIGGINSIVDLDEFEVGGIGSAKQNSLILLEKNKNGKLGRLRFTPMPDKTFESLELYGMPQLAPGTSLQSDGKKGYKKLATRYFNKFELKQVASWEENHSHKFLNDLNTIVGNLKTWYRGTHHKFALKNLGYYLNEFAYRFNRRRSEKNIFIKLLTRSIERPLILKSRELFTQEMYLPIAS